MHFYNYFRKISYIIKPLLYVALFSLLFALGCGSYRNIIVETLTGEVSVNEEGSVFAAFAGQKLISGDTVTTRSMSDILMTVDTDKHILAGSDTVFSVEASGKATKGKVTIRLESGNTLITIDEKLSKKSEFEVTTPNATMGVRGTTFKVTYDPMTNTTTVEVTDGVVEVIYAGGETTELNAGDSATITGDTLTKSAGGTDSISVADAGEEPAQDDGDYKYYKITQSDRYDESVLKIKAKEPGDDITIPREEDWEENLYTHFCGEISGTGSDGKTVAEYASGYDTEGRPTGLCLVSFDELGGNSIKYTDDGFEFAGYKYRTDDNNLVISSEKSDGSITVVYDRDNKGKITGTTVRYSAGCRDDLKKNDSSELTYDSADRLVKKVLVFDKDKYTVTYLYNYDAEDRISSIICETARFDGSEIEPADSDAPEYLTDMRGISFEYSDDGKRTLITKYNGHGGKKANLDGYEFLYIAGDEETIEIVETDENFNE